MSNSRTRKRSLQLDQFKGSSVSFGTPGQASVHTVTGTQTTVSSGHQYSKLGKTDEDIGGSFSTVKQFYRPLSVVRAHAWKSGSGSSYGVGWAVPRPPQWSLINLALPTTSDAQLDAFGASAIAKINPLKPTFDGAVNAAELLREGIPKAMGSALLKSRLRDARKLGDEYLNFQFGWMPIVSGLKDLAKAVTTSEKIVAQLYRDNGRNIRRRYAFPDVTNIETSESLNVFPYTGNINNLYSPISRGNMYTTKTTVTKRWFSGCFTYFLPMDDSQLSRLRRMSLEAKKLYGLRLSPEVVWNLTPWSWAADWFANTGDVISNLSSFSQDGLVMRYGYMMEQTTVTWNDSMNVTIGGIPYHLETEYGVIRKVRRTATPYGFGLNFDGFSAYQLGIIGALGISNVPKGRSRS